MIEILTGDCQETLKSLPAEFIQCCVTSPPYWGLRDYGCEGQLGLEKTPEEYVRNMTAVFSEVWRVLKSDGTLWLNLGDSYATGGSGQNFHDPNGERKGGGRVLEVGGFGHVKTCRNPRDIGLKPKDLVGIPWRVAFALQAAGWYLRSDIIWHKPNPMPESVTDRPTKSHEYLFLLTKSERYFYDACSIKESATSEKGKGATGRGTQGSAIAVGANGKGPQQDHSGWMGGDGESRNKRTVWTVTTQPYAEAHFATFPPDLIRPCIRAGSKPGDTILDPFGGSGTTGMVAIEEGRRAILCELNPDYIKLIRKRTNVTPGLPIQHIPAALALT